MSGKDDPNGAPHPAKAAAGGQHNSAIHGQTFRRKRRSPVVALRNKNIPQEAFLEPQKLVLRAV